MAHPDVTAVILAAGKGTRMGSDLAKVLHPLEGKPLIGHVLDTCRQLGLGQSVVVVGWQREQVAAAVAPWRADCVVQDQQLGTGHAVRCSEAVVRQPVVLVLCGDTPLIDAPLLARLLSVQRSKRAACTVIAAKLADAGRYGRMITDAAGRLLRIVEFKDATPEERAVNLINSGIYAFDTAALFAALKEVRSDNAQGEYYLTDVVGVLAKAGKPIELVVTDDEAAVMGINTPQELAEAGRLMRGRRATFS